MKLQEKMFSEVEQWMSSGERKTKFLEGKDYSGSKFDYWLFKWKSFNQAADGIGFREVDFSNVNPIAIGLGKVLEIESPSGFKITVFA